MVKFVGVLVVGFLSLQALYAQDYQLGIMPEVNLTIPLDDRLKWRSSLESRFQVYEVGDDFSEWQFTPLLADWANLILWKSGASTSLASGYLVRIREESTQHRIMQQFRITSNLVSSRLGHRIASDQTFTSGGATRWRGRYRITWEKPLNGQRVDPGEFYLKLAHEYLYLTQDGSSDWEIRFSPVIGLEIAPSKGIEFGLDTRFKNLRNNADREMWVTVTYFSVLDLFGVADD